MDKDKLEKELALVVMNVLMKHVTTGYHGNGNGCYLDCNVNFRYLHNGGAILLEELTFKSEVSEFNKKI